MIDELDHLDEEVLFLGGTLFAFGVDFDYFVDAFAELFLFFCELLAFLLVFGLGLAYGCPVLSE